MSNETAQCRRCGKGLVGKAYYLGGQAYFPETMERVPVNFYGGYACTRECDRAVSLEVESSMPGSGNVRRLSSHALECLERSWP